MTMTGGSRERGWALALAMALAMPAAALAQAPGTAPGTQPAEAQVAAPETTSPGTTAPGTTAPETTAPGMAAPGMAAPGMAQAPAPPVAPSLPADPATAATPTQAPAVGSAPSVGEASTVGGAPAVGETPAPAEAVDAGPAAVEPAARTAAAPGPAHDLSPWGMFMAADIVVKSVMIGLAIASLATWTIALAKSVELLAAGRSARRGLDALTRSRDLASAEEALGEASGPVALMVRAARAEAGDSAGAIRAGDLDGLLPRISSHLSRIEAGAGRRLAIGTGVLATIGSTAPFVGLFGTVWGIMNSFIGISESQTTNLAVVAPGIAEALLATALGLVAAIPAVVVYNHFARQTAAYKARLADAAAAVERLASRDLDHRRLVGTTGPFARAAE